MVGHHPQGLALLSFTLWHLTWLPAAVLIGLTVVQRFVYNAGELNTASPFRSQRVAYFQSIALMAVAMLVLGHGAAAGFDSEELSVVSDHVSLSVVAFIWLVVLTARHVRNVPLAATAARAPVTTGPPRVTDLAANPGEEAGAVPASWSWMLDPNLRLVAFTGRGTELAALTSWAGRRDAMRLALVTGPGGGGKTRLALELCDRGRLVGLTCAWIPPGLEHSAIRGLRLAGIHRALLVIDGAETRPGLGQLIARLAASEGEGLRVLLLARTTGEWVRTMRAASPEARDLVDNSVRERLALRIELGHGLSNRKIAVHGVTSIAREFDLRESRVETREQKNSKPEIVLNLLAEALAGTMTDAGLAESGTGTVRIDLRRNLSRLLAHEQEFWQERAKAVGLLGVERGPTAGELRQVIAVSCLLGADSAARAGRLATRILGMAGSKELEKWLDEICAASRSGTAIDGFCSRAG